MGERYLSDVLLDMGSEIKSYLQKMCTCRDPLSDDELLEQVRHHVNSIITSHKDRWLNERRRRRMPTWKDIFCGKFSTADKMAEVALECGYEFFVWKGGIYKTSVLSVDDVAPLWTEDEIE